MRAHLEAAATVPPRRSDGARFRLAVDRVFTLSGVGVVVTGTVHAGSVRVGDRVEISPSGIVARVRSLHAQNRASEKAEAGDRCALGLAGPDVAKDAIRRGDVALDPALHAPTDRIDALLRVVRPKNRNRSDKGFRSVCITARRKSGRGSRRSATARSRRAPRPRCNSCSTGRSPLRPWTGSSCATSRRSGLWAADAFSI